MPSFWISSYQPSSADRPAFLILPRLSSLSPTLSWEPQSKRARQRLPRRRRTPPTHRALAPSARPAIRTATDRLPIRRRYHFPGERLFAEIYVLMPALPVRPRYEEPTSAL